MITGFFMKQYFEVIFEPVDTIESDILIARLDDLGFYAYESTGNILKAYTEDPVDEAEIHGLGSNLQLTDKWFFQNFRNHQVLDPAYLLLTPYDDVKVHSLVELARKYAKATIR